MPEKRKCKGKKKYTKKERRPEKRKCNGTTSSSTRCTEQARVGRRHETCLS